MTSQPERLIPNPANALIITKLQRWVDHKRSQRTEAHEHIENCGITDLKVLSEAEIAYRIISHKTGVLNRMEYRSVLNCIEDVWNKLSVESLDERKQEDLEKLYEAAGWNARHYLLTGIYLGTATDREKLRRAIKKNMDSKMDIGDITRMGRQWVTYRIIAQDEPINNQEIKNLVETTLEKDFQRSLTNIPPRDTEPITKDFNEAAIALGYLRLFQSGLPIKAGQIILS